MNKQSHYNQHACLLLFSTGGKTPEEKKVLKVIDVNFNTTSNASEHLTSEFEITEARVERGRLITPNLVVRRGAPFDIVIKFDRNYDNTTDDLKLVFDTGKSLDI